MGQARDAHGREVVYRLHLIVDVGGVGAVVVPQMDSAPAVSVEGTDVGLGSRRQMGCRTAPERPACGWQGGRCTPRE